MTGRAEPEVGTVSLERPYGKKSPRRPGMPETMRLVAASQESQKVGEFLEWLSTDSEYVLGTYDDEHDRFYPAWPSITQLLARFYGIDLDRVERERRRLLAYLRTRGSA